MQSKLQEKKNVRNCSSIAQHNLAQLSDKEK